MQTDTAPPQIQESSRPTVAAATEPAPRGEDAALALDRALSHLLSIQNAEGGWEGEMVWNTMILSQYVIVMKTLGRPIPELARDKMLLHYRVTRNRDGGWGMHSESPSYVFFTTLAYVALRLLGVGPDEPLCKEARAWLHRQPGGVLAIPTWGKFWLAICELYEFEGVNPFPPELFILPEWIPLQPVHYYCHTRYIYLAIAYLYGRRFRCKLGPVVHELRKELYSQPYEEIDFARYRHEIAETDLYVRPSPVLRAAYDAMYAYEARAFQPLRKKALAHCFDRILYEQRASRYQGLSPVNGLLNLLALYAHSPHHPDLPPSLEGIESWKWDDEIEGIRYAGARSNTWDTAFVLQAIESAPAKVRARPELQRALARGYQNLQSLQMQAELPHAREERRDPILGGFCFSDGAHRWAVSDCTAEAMTALISIQRDEAMRIALPESERIVDERLRQAARFVLLRRNADGGFGTYERRRGSALLEHVNPSEMYGSCMTERSYLECTASSVRGLAYLLKSEITLGPGLAEGVRRAIDDGITRLRRAQRDDGSFPGFWGINFTYAIFHVVKALRAAGVPATDALMQRATQWLACKQREDGGWGEHYTSCLDDRYVEHPQSQVVMTSWALLALLEVRPVKDPAIERGIAWLCAQQQPDGGFPQQAQNGVFFGTAMLDYRLYKSYFPAWALARYARLRSE